MSSSLQYQESGASNAAIERVARNDTDTSTTDTPATAAAAAAAAAQHHHNASGRQSTTAAAAAAQLASGKVKLNDAVRYFQDFPIKGVNFIDIMPWFLDSTTHNLLLHCLELQIQLNFGNLSDKAAQHSSVNTTTTTSTGKIDVVVGLDARGFLFGPSLALRLDASFVPVRKKGKLPGPCITAAYEKEYGTDYFEMQEGSIRPGQTVLIVDDIIATGGSAAAAGNLVTQLGGTLIGYLFIVEISFLKGRSKLGTSPVVTLLEEDS